MNKKQIFFLTLGIFCAFGCAQGATVSHADLPHATHVPFTGNICLTVVHRDSLVNLVRSVIANTHLTIIGKMEVLKVLLAGVRNLNEHEANEPLMLMALCMCGPGRDCFKLLALLKDSGASVNAQNPVTGWTVLHSACGRTMSKTLTQFLVEKCHADINILNYEGKTPLDCALATHHAKALKIAEWLKEQGAKRSVELVAVQEFEELEQEQLFEEQEPVVLAQRRMALPSHVSEVRYQSFIEQLEAPLVTQEIPLLDQLPETCALPTLPIAPRQEDFLRQEQVVGNPDPVIFSSDFFSDDFFGELEIPCRNLSANSDEGSVNVID
ncbi:ankyrin repeat domain-containing protein [Candidatus Babeliales bacterium]|nr:ankyrin repeat domain-containing protein [Candidatus Babeliales bacterium]